MPLPSLRRPVAFGAVAALACTLAVAAVAPATAAVVPSPPSYSADGAVLGLSAIGSFETGVFDESAAEIVHAYGDRLYVVNAQAGAVDVLDFSNPAAMKKLYSLSAEGVANSVAIRSDGLGVIALEASVKTDPGELVFFDANADVPTILGSVTVGALPDMVTISADGGYAVAANEGEPAADFSIDPEGSIAVVSLPATLTAPTQDAARIADFHAYEAPGALPAGVRVFGPTPHGADRPISRNLEPEYITVDGGTAYATLQENNAIAVIDLASASVTDIHPLGAKDLSLAKNALDASDKDGGYNLRTYPNLHGLYMPDSIDSYTTGGETYLVTANEGDAREWGSYTEGVRVKSLSKSGKGPICTGSPLAGLTADKDLGRLNVTREDGFDSAAGCYTDLYAFGGRSFSIWSTTGTQVWDSGSSFEEITHAAEPDFFNSNHTASGFDGRSDDKGPEPEAITIGELSGRTYAFIGFERVGGIAAYDITDPTAPTFVTYLNNRDFAQSVEDGGNLATAGDLGPEGIEFIAAADSPTGTPLLAVGNEVSGTTTLFEIDDRLAPRTTDIQVLTINDFHGRLAAEPSRDTAAGAAVLAGAVKQFRATNPNTLFVSAGDNIGASTFDSFIAKDTPTIDALKSATLDLSAVGNHEFDRGFADLTGRVIPRYDAGNTTGKSDYALGANVYDATGAPALKEYTVKTVDGVRTAFIGTVTETTPAKVTPSGIQGLTFGSQLAAANRVAAKITAADEADVIVLLAHEGLGTSDCSQLTGDSVFAKLARGASPEIDAIVSADSHQKYSCQGTIDGAPGKTRPVIQAHQYGTTLGKLDIEVDARTKDLVSITGSLVPLVSGGTLAFPADAPTAKIVKDAVDSAAVEGQKVVGKISADITRGGTNGSRRDVESSLSNFLSDVYLWATSNASYAGTKAQIGIMNPGGVRADLVKTGDGSVTYRDVATVQPFANTLVTVTLTGTQLRSILEEQWRADGSKLHLGVSGGFAYTYDPAAAAGSRIKAMTFQGRTIAPTDTFTVVTNSFLAAGGDAFTTFAAGTNRADTGQVDLQASVEYFAAHAIVDPAPLGRSALATTGGGETGNSGTGGGTGNGNGETPSTVWATVDVGNGRVAQGGSLAVAVSGLKPGQQIAATLHSDPIVVTGIPAADASGKVTFAVAVPASLPVGAHTLVIESAGFAAISVPIEVVAAGSLPDTGGTFPIGFVTVLGLGTLLAGALVLARRRAATA